MSLDAAVTGLITKKSAIWTSDLKQLIFSFFQDEIFYVLSKGSGSIYIVSPWISNFQISKSSYSSLLRIENMFYGSPLHNCDLLTLIKRYIELGGLIIIITLPPWRIIRPSDVKSYVEVYKLYKDAVLKRDERLKTTLASIMQSLRSRILKFIGVFELLHNLTEYKNKVRVFWKDNLHSKAIVGNHSAIIGSANITRFAMENNEEVLLLAKSPEIIDSLRRYCIKIINNSKNYDIDVLRDKYKEVLSAESSSDVRYIFRLLKME